jgi:hypothetical protein
MKLNDSKLYIFQKTGIGEEQTAITNLRHDLRQGSRDTGRTRASAGGEASGDWA